MPLEVALINAFILKYKRAPDRPIALSLLIGIWVVGPTMIMLGWTFAGSGFKSGGLAGNLLLVIFLTAVPFFLVLLSGLDFTILGLGLAIVTLIWVHHRFERRWMIPPKSAIGGRTPQ
jgi:hypothetical protein